MTYRTVFRRIVKTTARPPIKVKVTL